MIKVKEVKGLLIEKKPCSVFGSYLIVNDGEHNTAIEKPYNSIADGDKFDGLIRSCVEGGFNHCLDQIGEVGIGLNRERLAMKLADLFESLPIASVEDYWDKLSPESKNKYLWDADAIISQLPQLLEVVTDK